MANKFKVKRFYLVPVETKTDEMHLLFFLQNHKFYYTLPSVMHGEFLEEYNKTGVPLGRLVEKYFKAS